MAATIGVLVTYFNEKELLGECLASVLHQTDKPDEILIYDDASEYPARDYVPPEFIDRIIRGEKNRGPACGRNALLKASHSQYVHFQDADDLLRKDWCEQVRAAVAGPSQPDVIFTEVSSFQEDGSGVGGGINLKRLSEAPDFVQYCIEVGIFGASGTYRREKALALNGFREALWQAEDYDFHIRLAVSQATSTLVLEPLVQIRVRASNRSHNYREVWDSTVQALQMLSEELPARYLPDLAEKAVVAGSRLFQLGDRRRAHDAIELAKKIGPPVFRGYRSSYRWMAKLCGQEIAETIAGLYRSILPRPLRSFMRRTP